MERTVTRPLETPAPEISVATEEEEYRRDVLLRAAEIMERDGYEHGPRAMAADANTPVCLLGAVGRAIGSSAVIDQDIWDFFAGEDVLFSRTMYDYGRTTNFVGENVDPRDVWFFSDRMGQDAVVKALRAMANGKSFEEAARGDS